MNDLKFKEFTVTDGDKKDKFSDTPLKDLPLTMSYVPMQEFDGVYDNEKALMNGTLFMSLNKPFCGKFTGEYKK